MQKEEANGCWFSHASLLGLVKAPRVASRMSAKLSFRRGSPNAVYGSLIQGESKP